MGGIIDKITDFIKEMLQGWVLSNLETMFTDVNDKENAGTEVTSDILFLKKRDRVIDIEPDWVHLCENEDQGSL